MFTKSSPVVPARLVVVRPAGANSFPAPGSSRSMTYFGMVVFFLFWLVMVSAAHVRRTNRRSMAGPAPVTLS